MLKGFTNDSTLYSALQGLPGSSAFPFSRPPRLVLDLLDGAQARQPDRNKAALKKLRSQEVLLSKEWRLQTLNLAETERIDIKVKAFSRSLTLHNSGMRVPSDSEDDDAGPSVRFGLYSVRLPDCPTSRA